MDINRKRRKWLKLLASLIGFAFIIFMGSVILTLVIQKKIGQAFKDLSPKININYSSIHVNLFASSVSINDLHIYIIPYNGSQQHQHSFYFPHARLQGINFFKIIISNQFFVNDLSLEKAEIKLDQFLLDKKDSAQAVFDHLNVPFKKISISNLKLLKADIWLHSGLTNQLLLNGNITIQDAEILALNKPSKTPKFQLGGIKCSLSDINYPSLHAPYTIQVKHLLMDSKKEILQIDSLKIIPQNYHFEYGEKKLDQTFQVAAGAVKIEITKFDLLQILLDAQQNKYSSNKNLYTSSISVLDLSMRLILYNKRQQHQQSFYFKHVLFTGVNFVRIIFNESIFINNLNFEQGDIKLDPFLLESKNTSPAKFLAYSNIPFKKVSINNLSLSGAKIWLHSDKVNQTLLRGDIAINKVELDGLNKSVTNEFHLGAIECNFSNINYSLPDSYYTIHIKKLIADSRKEILRIDSLKVIPLYSKFEFGKYSGHQADRVEATIAEIAISKLDIIQLINKKLIADKVIFTNSNVSVFRDRRLHRQLKAQLMPDGYLKKIPLEVRVNTFKINNASVLYEEFPKGGTQTGMLKIGKINLSMSPVLNHPHKNDPDYSDTYLKGLLMDAGTIQATIRAPFKKNIYYIKGDIKNLDLPKLNTAAENLGKFHIESGILNDLDFHFTATDEKAIGEIIGEYHDLVIDRLKVKNGIKKMAKIPTFFLKHFIIPKNKDKSMNAAKRTGKIYYKRDPTRFVAFYFLKSLLSGITASFALGFLLPK